jgi:Rod binding domain-containing protein
MDGMAPISDCGFRVTDCRADLRLQSDQVSGGDEKKKQLARDFESVLLTKMFDEVRQSIGQWSFEEGEEDGASEQVHGLFWLYLAQDVADKGGFGLWQEIYRHFGDIEGTGRTGERIDREL